MEYFSLRLQETVREVMYNFGPKMRKLSRKTTFTDFPALSGDDVSALYRHEQCQTLKSRKF